MILSGGCHCGEVRFHVEIDRTKVFEVVSCNCSICKKTGFLHLIVPRSKFSLLQGQNSLTTYTFNTGVAKHTFCGRCGVKAFYTPRSNPDGVDVNVHCLDRLPEEMVIKEFDGQNWEENAASLAHLSEDPPR